MTRMTNRVFVLGGGRMGLVAARDLVESNLVDAVVIGDIDLSRAEGLAKEIGSKKVEVTKVDATDHQRLVLALKRCSVLVNAVWYEYNVAVMRAAIEARVHYNDLGGLFHVTRKQIELDQEAKRAGISAVLGGGESPGISNVMCAASAREMDSVEEIRIRVGGREMTASDKLLFPFAVSTVFDEYSKPPVMFLDGRFQEVETLSGEEDVEFPPPVGRNRCHYSIHSEIATLPASIKGVRNVDFKLGVSEKIFKVIKPLLDAGFDDTRPIDIAGHRVSPRDFAIAYLNSLASSEEPYRSVALMTTVSGRKDGRRVGQTRTVIGEPSGKLGVKNGTAFLTGIAASIVAQLIVSEQIVERGALAPELCIPPGLLFDELRKRGVGVEAGPLVPG